MKSQYLRGIIEKAIEEYNKYRSPEVTAKLLSLNRNFFEIEFKGYFCYTCGFYDYFDDLKILLEDLNIKTKIIEIIEKDEGAIVKFSVKTPST